ncbi:MAG: family 10 glycosylhydrolase [Planctomycetes bacterium]|nr:family 10 glycosylhydrolase [Planctomycetota bacterium]
MMRFSSLTFVVLLTLGACTHDTRSGTPEHPRLIAPKSIRALWVDSWNAGISSRSECDLMIDTAVKDGFNTLLVEVRKVGDAYYQSHLEPRGLVAGTDEVVDRNFDPLAYIIERARHGEGLRVEAWIVANRIWKGLEAPRPSDPPHVVNAHPNWLLRNAAGEIRDRSAGDSIYLDPAVPEARSHVARVAADIARKYRVDAIHLDYIRYPGGAWQHDDPRRNDLEYVRERAAHVLAEVRGIRNAIRLENPDVELTAATLSWGTLPDGGYRASPGYLEACQDWPTWCEQGLIDVAYVMHYKREALPDQSADFRNWLDEFRRIRAKGSARIVPGIGSYLNDAAGNAAQESAVLESGLDGVAHFSYANPVKR